MVRSHHKLACQEWGEATRSIAGRKERSHARRNSDKRRIDRNALRGGLYACRLSLALRARLTAARCAYQTGSGPIGAGLFGLVVASAAFGALTFLFGRLRSPIFRLIVALVFAAPAAIAGYALVHGVTEGAVPWRSGGKSSASSAAESRDFSAGEIGGALPGKNAGVR